MAQFRMRLSETEDQVIIDWLNAQADKTAAVKALILAAATSIGCSQDDSTPAHTQSQVDLSADTLVALRTIVDAALAEHLAGLTLGTTQQPDVDPELDAKLDTMF